MGTDNTTTRIVEWPQKNGPMPRRWSTATFV